MPRRTYTNASSYVSQRPFAIALTARNKRCPQVPSRRRVDEALALSIRVDITLRTKGIRTTLWEMIIQSLHGLDIETNAAEIASVLRNIEKKLAHYIPMGTRGNTKKLHVSEHTRDHPIREYLRSPIAARAGPSQWTVDEIPPSPDLFSERIYRHQKIAVTYCKSN